MSSNNISINLTEQAKFISMKGMVSWGKVILIRVQNAKAVARQRRRLAQLDSSQLKDIGISRSDALAESSRGFWDIPQNLK
jgi:uncharacterized protein YjiS (DUF1127 family)